MKVDETSTSEVASERSAEAITNVAPLPLARDPSFYRCHRAFGIFVAVFLVPFQVAGAILLFAMTLRSDWGFAAFATIWCSVVTLATAAVAFLLFGSLSVGPDGITRWWGSLAVGRYSWDDVEKWAVLTSALESQQATLRRLYPEKSFDIFPLYVDSDSRDARALIARLNGRSQPLVISDQETMVPGFDRLVADVRLYVSQKELV